MDDPATIEIRYTPGASGTSILPGELDLLESMLPDLIHAMMEVETAEAD
ncbi:MAG: hypothetical protein AB7K73_03450 [Gammaproteobacteria bacterium]